MPRAAVLVVSRTPAGTAVVSPCWGSVLPRLSGGAARLERRAFYSIHRVSHAFSIPRPFLRAADFFKHSEDFIPLTGAKKGRQTGGPDDEAEGDDDDEAAEAAVLRAMKVRLLPHPAFPTRSAPFRRVPFHAHAIFSFRSVAPAHTRPNDSPATPMAIIYALRARRLASRPPKA